MCHKLIHKIFKYSVKKCIYCRVHLSKGNMRGIDTFLKLKILCAQQCSSPGCSYYRINHKGSSKKEETQKRKKKINTHQDTVDAILFTIALYNDKDEQKLKKTHLTLYVKWLYIPTVITIIKCLVSNLSLSSNCLCSKREKTFLVSLPILSNQDRWLYKEVVLSARECAE